LQRYSAILVVSNLDIACEVANDIATEHLQIITRDDDEVLQKIRNAGAIFLGPYTPVAVGDYYAGPSHVLPTGGTAKFYGPLSVNDFLKASSVLRYNPASLQEDGENITDFATREGLTAHAASVRKRKS
jgi:histidinol dehydrogenase